uniref:C-type lectin domain-containing protein n=1 Tax=Oryzias latipes TaxID=8090 RepID=A0A3B3HDN8_ORYLA
YPPPLFPTHELDLAVPSVQDHLRRCQDIWLQTRADLMTWTQAQKYCRKNHTDLATVTNMIDVKKLDQTAEQRPAWIGLKKYTNSNKKWHWSLPGLSFIKEEAYWSYDEPNNHQSELCVFLRENLTWVDDKCSKNQCFICYNGELSYILFFQIIKIKHSFSAWESFQHYTL